MRALTRARWATLPALLLALIGATAADAAPKPRNVLILPFATVDLTRDEHWIGEGVAQSLMLSLVHVPGLVQIERERIRALPQPEAWDEAAAVSAAKRLGADLALFGEVKRTGTDLIVQPRFVELHGDKVDRGALDTFAVADGQLLDRLRQLPAAYLKAMKAPASDVELARAQKWAAPTTVVRAFELYVRGRQASYRGTQDASEAAVEFLSRAIEADPQFVAAQYALGVVHQNLGNRWKAAAQFRASAQLDPTYAEPYKALGDLYLTAPRRLFEEAIKAYGKAIELRPFYAEAHVGLGDALAAKGEVDPAVAAYQKGLEYNPMNAKVHVSLGKIYYSEKGLYYESVTAYKKAIDLDPGYLDARMGLAEVYEDKGLYKEAIDEYRKVVDADPKNSGALYNLALVYEKVDPKEAMSLWERYIALAGSQPSEKDWVDVARLHLKKLKQQHGN
ncbi:MAG TPA: tetratricopeptide repeat protein [Verrucomicrobiae bacterium]|jgi:tetratricopeptide (TPR) repeat protein|nr:tetratricopeptide repeat protein [Verrucomicrobiae bacterium]